LIVEAEAVYDFAQKFPDLRLVNSNGLRARFFLEDASKEGEVLAGLKSLRTEGKVQDFSFSPLSLEHIFNRVVTDAVISLN
jgi:hypothetical protein